jgi:putative endonuclease
MTDKEYWVYVLRNPGGTFYIGLTADLQRRLDQHNEGESKWTAKHRPWELVWQRGPLSLSEARKLENRLKRQRGGRGFLLLTGLRRSL